MSKKQIKAAICFTDIKKSSYLWSKYPGEMISMLSKHDKIIRKFVDENSGLVVKTIGDAFMLKFNNLKDALRFIVATQLVFKTRPLRFKNSTDKLEIRAGIAFGTVNNKKIEIQGKSMVDFFGGIVNLASRMESKVSKVGGFGLLLPIDSDSKNYLENNCYIEHEQFINDIERCKRSNILICRSADELHINDGKTYNAYSCTLK